MVDGPTEPRAPDFLIVGAQRAGTTSLFDALAAHPLMTPPTRREIHYFDLRYRRGGRWYRRQFRRPPGARSGESSPYYLFHPRVPDRVAADLPGVPVIALVRDPIDRAWSQHQLNRATGREDLPFLDALAAESGRLDGVRPPRRDRHRLTHRDHSYAARGRYLEQLDRWSAAIGPDRLLVVDSASLFAEPAQIHRRVLAHVGLVDRPLPTPHRHRSAERLDAATREAARPYFVDERNALADRYGVELAVR